MLAARRPRDTRNVHADSAQGAPDGKIQRRPIGIAPGHIGGLGARVNRLQMCAFPVEDPDATGPRAIDVALDQLSLCC
jgi:hypothetical protein